MPPSGKHIILSIVCANLAVVALGLNSRSAYNKTCSNEFGTWTYVESTKCKAGVPQQVPGAPLGRIAVVFWKQSFRGPNGLGPLVQKEDEAFSCTPEAESIQRATSASHVKHIIEPLEESGHKVDVFLLTSTCSNGMHVKLKGMYDEGRTRVAYTHFYAPTDSQFDSASLSADMILNYLSNSTQHYDSYLLWRYDVVPLQALNSSNYLSLATTYFSSDNDLAMSFPGQMAPCLFKTLADRCVGMGDVVSQRAHEVYLGLWSFECIYAKVDCAQLARFDWPQSVIYRGQIGAGRYGLQPARTCNFLRNNFGGPSCLAEDAAQTVCRYVCSKRSHPETCLPDFWNSLEDAPQDNELEIGQKIVNCSGYMP